MKKTVPSNNKWRKIINDRAEALCAVRCTYTTVYLKNDDGKYIRMWSFQRRDTGNNAVIRFITQADLYYDKNADFETLGDIYNINATHRGFLTEYAIQVLRTKAPHDPVINKITTKTPIYFRPQAVIFESNGIKRMLGLLALGGVASYLLYRKNKRKNQ